MSTPLALEGEDWRRYGPCPQCEVPEGEPCIPMHRRPDNPGPLKRRPHIGRQRVQPGFSADIPTYYVEKVEVGGRTLYAVMRERGGRHKAVLNYVDSEIANRQMGLLTQAAPYEA